jgi:DNA helicase TIP49 (TBP-interacting protein)
MMLGRENHPNDCYGRERSITLTQQSLGEKSMTRRETVATTLAKWNRDGVVELSRGAIYIRNADKLRSLSCECYSWIQQSYLDELNL